MTRFRETGSRLPPPPYRTETREIHGQLVEVRVYTRGAHVLPDTTYCWNPRWADIAPYIRTPQFDRRWV